MEETKMRSGWFQTCVGYADKGQAAVTVQGSGTSIFVLTYTVPQMLVWVKEANPNNPIYAIKQEGVDLEVALSEASDGKMTCERVEEVADKEKLALDFGGQFFTVFLLIRDKELYKIP